MYAALASVALGSAALWPTTTACLYNEQPSSVMYGNNALRVPIASRGAPAQNECAETAQAFGLAIASIVPRELEGSGSECVLFGQPRAGTCGAAYEVHTGAITLSNITECDATKVQAVADAALALDGAGSDASLGSGTTATKILNTAAVGKAIYSDLSVPFEEDCLVACALYIKGCTHITAAIAQGKMPKCSFHGSPTQGVQAQGSSTYYNIAPSAQMAARNLGAAFPKVAVPPSAVSTAPAVAPVPAPVSAPVVPPLAAPALPVEPLAPAAAAPAAGAQPVGAIETLLYTPPGTCPGETITDVPAGKHEPSLEPPEEVVDQYADVVGADGKFEMLYTEIVNGGAYCVQKGSTVPTVTVGGNFFFKTDAGECIPPPVTEEGEPCCEVYMWQPNTAGFYYDNCSMKMKIQPNGLFYFETEMPGDESLNGWGPDPEPHIHFDVLCSGCAAHDVVNGEYTYWNKFYPEDLCTIEGCGEQGEVHQAEELQAAGQTVYKYDFVLPSVIREKNGAKK